MGLWTVQLWIPGLHVEDVLRSGRDAVVGRHEVREKLLLLRREAAEPRRADLVENAVYLVAVQLVHRLHVDALPVRELPVGWRGHREIPEPLASLRLFEPAQVQIGAHISAQVREIGDAAGGPVESA